MTRPRRLTPTQELLEAAARAPFLAVLVALAFAGELVDRLPDPRAALCVARNARARRIR